MRNVSSTVRIQMSFTSGHATSCNKSQENSKALEKLKSVSTAQETKLTSAGSSTKAKSKTLFASDSKWPMTMSLNIPLRSVSKSYNSLKWWNKATMRQMPKKLLVRFKMQKTWKHSSNSNSWQLWLRSSKSMQRISISSNCNKKLNNK